MHVHGGGPTICREELDIYSMETSPETDLCLEELRGKAASDFARRISRQFVDDCKGDLESYEQKYDGPSPDGDVVMECDPPSTADKNDSVGDVRRRDDLEDRAKKLAAEIEELKRIKTLQVQDLERQVKAVRSDLQHCQSRLKDLRDLGAGGHAMRVPRELDITFGQTSGHPSPDAMAAAIHDDELGSEMQKAKALEQRLEQKERELHSEQRNADENIALKEEALRRCKLELKSHPGEDQMRRA